MAISIRSLAKLISRRQRQTAKKGLRRRLLCEPLEARRVLATNLATISGLVFIDATGDGLTAGEQVPGATVHLFRDVNGNGVLEANGADGAPIQTTLTTGSGSYRFDGLTAGAYFVQQPAQPSLNLTLQVSDLVQVTADQAMGVPGVTIDTFNETTQQVSVSGGGTQSSSVTPAPDALGNERDMFVQVTSVTGQLDIQANGAVPGVLAAGGLGAATGPRVISWDGIDGDGATLNPLGLAGVDLSNGGLATAVQLAIGASEAGGQARMKIYTSANFISEAIFNIPQTPTGGPTGAVVLDFATQFVSVGASGGANFSNVGAIEFILDSAIIDVDMQMDEVSTVGPTIIQQNFDNFLPIDLELTKTVDNPSPDINALVTYTIVLSHVDDEADGTIATNIQVRDVLPAGVEFVSSNPTQGDYNPTTGIWTVGSLTPNTTATLMITVRVLAPGVKINIAEVIAADQFDIDSTPNNNNPNEDDQDQVEIDPAVIDLELTKTVDKPLPNVGDNVVFTVTVRNVAGNTEATNVVVRDLLPSGLSLESNVPSQGTYVPTTGVWTVGTLANNGGTATLLLTTEVTAQGAYTNTAEVIAADQFDIDSTPNNNVPAEDDQDSVNVQTAVIDLQLAKTVNNAAPNIGQNVTFTINVSNQGPNGATNVAVSDPLPAGLTFVSASPSQGTYDSATGIWTIGSMGPTGSVSMNLVATVATAGAKTNIAQVSQADQFDIDSTPGNNIPAEDDQDQVVVVPLEADVSLTKTVNNATPPVGQNVTFTITLGNAGPGNATNLVVADLLPTGLTFVSATPSQGTYNSTNGVWTVGTLNNAAQATMLLVATVATAGTFTNVAEVTSMDQNDPDSTPGNNVLSEDDQDQAQVVAQLVDLSITKTDSPDPVTAGEQITYVVTVNNNGPGDATGVEVQENLPAGVTIVSATVSQGTYNQTTNVWLVGNLADDASATMTLIVAVGQDVSGTLTNTAIVSANEQEDNLSNNTAQVSTQVTPRSSSLGGFVYLDVNNDGVKDPTEPGIAGVTITLIGAVTGTRTTLTDAAGAYVFENLAPDNYTIQETQPSSFRDGLDTAPATLEGDPDGFEVLNDVFQDIDLVAGVHGRDFNFGELPGTLSKRRFLASSV